MKISFKILFFLFLFFIIACSSKNEKISILEDENLELQMIDAYKEGYEELEKGDIIYAAKKFNEAELLYPQSEWAPKSVLLSAYAYYSQNYYEEALDELDRFFKKYPKHKTCKNNDNDLSYSITLLGLKHYFFLFWMPARNQQT